MSQKKYRNFFIAAVIMALAAAGVAGYAWNTMMATTQVVKASGNIVQGQAISMLTDASMGKELKGALNSDTVINPAELEGLIAKGFIPASTTLRKSMFEPASMATVQSRLEPGQVAVAVAADLDTTCGGIVKKGSKADLIVTGKNLTEIIAQKVSVLEITTKSNGESAAVILSLNDQQGRRLMSAMSTGNKPVLFLLPPDEGNGALPEKPESEEVVQDVPDVDNGADVPGGAQPGDGDTPVQEPVASE